MNKTHDQFIADLDKSIINQRVCHKLSGQLGTIITYNTVFDGTYTVRLDCGHTYVMYAKDLTLTQERRQNHV